MDDMTLEERRAFEQQAQERQLRQETEGEETTESGLVVVTDKRGQEDDTPKDPIGSLLRKLDHLLLTWLPQQPEWSLIVGGANHGARKYLQKAMAKAIAKRLTTIPYRGY